MAHSLPHMRYPSCSIRCNLLDLVVEYTQVLENLLELLLDISCSVFSVLLLIITALRS